MTLRLGNDAKRISHSSFDALENQTNSNKHDIFHRASPVARGYHIETKKLRSVLPYDSSNDSSTTRSKHITT